jgi:hypothetical protein
MWVPVTVRFFPVWKASDKYCFEALCNKTPMYRMSHFVKLVTIVNIRNLIKRYTVTSRYRLERPQLPAVWIWSTGNPPTLDRQFPAGLVSARYFHVTNTTAGILKRDISTSQSKDLGSISSTSHKSCWAYGGSTVVRVFVITGLITSASYSID